MKCTRRCFVSAGLGLVLGGCASNPVARHDRPGVDWPGQPATGNRSAASLRLPTRQYPTAPTPPITPPTPPAVQAIQVIPRARWTSTGPQLGSINPMGQVSRITVHHEGWTPIWFTDWAQSVERLESVRRGHRGRGWADVGYHYIIDRAGRVWEGRDVRYQGAHVRDHNEHNIGVMLLGNFEEQRPAAAQLASANAVVDALARQHRVSPSDIYTHRELNRTSCPGHHLQAHMDWWRPKRVG